MDYYIAVSTVDNKVVSIAETPVFLEGAETFKVDISDEHAILNGLTGWHYIEGVLSYDENAQLISAKKQKLEELRNKCQQIIENGFDHVIEGVTYHFSLDTEAQQNFSDSYQLLKDGVIDEVVWTVTVDGVYGRCVINYPIMQELTRVIFNHKTQNITKLRDFLQPLVADSKTIEELRLIDW